MKLSLFDELIRYVEVCFLTTPHLQKYGLIYYADEVKMHRAVLDPIEKVLSAVSHGELVWCHHSNRWQFYSNGFGVINLLLVMKNYNFKVGEINSNLRHQYMKLITELFR